ncbi:hypothetical protein [Halpernia sp. GG3]
MEYDNPKTTIGKIISAIGVDAAEFAIKLHVIGKDKNRRNCSQKGNPNSR